MTAHTAERARLRARLRELDRDDADIRLKLWWSSVPWDLHTEATAALLGACIHADMLDHVMAVSPARLHAALRAGYVGR